MNIRNVNFRRYRTLRALAWFYSLNLDTADLSELVKKQDSPDYVGYKMKLMFSLMEKKNHLVYPIN